MDTDDDSIEEGMKLLLTYQGTNMGMMTVTSKFTPDKPLECVKVQAPVHLALPLAANAGAPIFPARQLRARASSEATAQPCPW